MMPTQNNNFNISIYSDNTENPTDLSHLKLNLSISANQTIALEEGENLHDLMIKIHETFENFNFEGQTTSFSFGINPSWNKTGEYNVYYSISVKEELSNIGTDITTLYENFKFDEFTKYNEDIEIQPLVLQPEYYSSIAL